MLMPAVAEKTSQYFWDLKYRFKRPDKTPIDMNVEDTWMRVAEALARAEKDDQSGWTDRFYNAMYGWKFLPAGRILAGAGTDRNVTLQNCYVMGTIGDDLGSIFDHLKEAALTMQQGGGIGYDFSPLRPEGALVKGVGADASGPISFMDVWDAMCKTIMSAGTRRGAMMATMLCSHPDIEKFIEAKRTVGRLTQFNMSVLITDAFMQAVASDSDWLLSFNGVVYKTIKARALWDKIMRSTYGYAEPGVIFIDRINKRNNLYYCEDIRATNPCGEQPLPPYGACLLGSLNLTQYVENPFTGHATLNGQQLVCDVGLSIRMMDNVIDVSRFPLEAQREQQRLKRRIGLGVTGLADALIMCGIEYGSPKALEATDAWLSLIERNAYLQSVALAKEKGPFPLFDKDQYLAGEHIQGLQKGVQEAIAEYGIRNSHLTSIAPTGTISLFAGNVSSGGEPVFAYNYTRKVKQPDGSKTEEPMEDFAYAVYKKMGGDTRDLPPYFVNAQTLPPEAHIAMQGAMQRHVDSSISKTINLPADISFDDFKQVYAKAYEAGCKGCTTYRPNEITGSVLSVEPDATAGAEPEELIPVADIEREAQRWLSKPASRPEELPGVTYKIKFGDSEHAFYVTVTDIEVDGRRRPYEVFFNSKNMEHYAWALALSRMISAVFRHGGDVSFVVDELKEVFDPKGGAFWRQAYRPSLLWAIGQVIHDHMVAIDFIATGGIVQNGPALFGHPIVGGGQCPKCHDFGLVRSEGCEKCTNCEYSKCG